ncbi:penicillin acylase family protein [Alteromonas sp. ASW11-130]|uniref:penicillin acylase family protein n=1 Tax=Alteromonas sp. ASW11-130 TaxID=3015775 RepID=UPI0022428921|nr:penicillin acylase family protein [Alteromonas sp. ASW11-130]MCW8090696.1 penicillin acylase family protein [Alteromonas sp. ASW11-130]
MFNTFTKYPMISRAVVFFVLPFILLCYFSFDHFFTDALPLSKGKRTIEGLNDEVSIRRDENGVIYIAASNDLDVYFSTGYVHAQDRLWQLELQRRISQGRLSEVFGKGTLTQDIWLRTLGVYRAAEEALPLLSKESSDALDAYAAGINAWIKQAKQLPVEFSILGIEPKPWTKVDSLAWSKMFALNLAGNYRNEIQKFIGAQQLSATQLQTFYPEVTPQKNSVDKKTVDKLEDIVKLQQSMESELKIGGQYVGSNAWVVSGDLTESGAPILANDPHLALQIPSLWYAISQKGKSLAVDGMSIVGLPVVIFGKNEYISWGGTNMMADVQDLFIEQLNENDPSKYLHNGEWHQFETRTEFINVKADFPAELRAPYKTVKVQVRETVNGPVISDVMQDLSLPISMRWIALQPGDTTFEAFYKLNYAKNWQEFNDSLQYHVAPALNFLYADKQNNIGMTGAGKIPVRQIGDGSMPLSGAALSSSWNKYISSNELPKYYNPPEGYLINANNNVADQDYPYLISRDFAPDYRARRIEQILKSKIDNNIPITVTSTIAAQKDEKDLSALNLLSYLQNVKPNNTQQSAAISTLKKWKGIASKDSVGATIFYGWVRHIRQSIFSDELSEFWNSQKNENYLALSNKLSNEQLLGLISGGTHWCDNITTSTQENCRSIILNALDDAFSELVKLKGEDQEDWAWGQVQHTLYAHTPFSNVKVLDNLFERKVEASGAQHTVNVSTSYFDVNEGYISSFGGGFRQIIEMGKTNTKHLIMNSTGQSGQIASPHYDDMIDKFASGEMAEFATPAATEELTLSLVSKKGNDL